MSIQYYIVQNGVKTGPYDLVALIRKIRNGSLTPETMMQVDETSAAKPAEELPALAEFFAEKRDEKAEPVAVVGRGEIRSHRLGEVLNDGWLFLQRNQVSTVFSGCIVLVMILVIAGIHVAVPDALRSGGYMMSFVLSYFLLTCYMLVVLRMARSQPIDLQYLIQKVLPVIKPLLGASFFVCLPCIVGLMLVMHGINAGDPHADASASMLMPKMNVWDLNTSNIGKGVDPRIFSVVGLGIFIFGIYVLSLYVFTPLLILEQGKSIWESMEMSREAVLKSGIENIGVLFALFVINFLAGLCALLPLALTLPITMAPVAVIYDEYFG